MLDLIIYKELYYPYPKDKNAQERRREIMEYTEIWNKAYNIFTDENRSEAAQYNDMQKYLMNEVIAGNLPLKDKFYIARDIIETSIIGV